MFTPPYHPPSPLPLKKGDKEIEIEKNTLIFHVLGFVSPDIQCTQ
jgi:hypothetical protein